MTTEISEGMVIHPDTVKQNNLSYKGKKLNFECVDKVNQTYQAKYELSDEEKKHNVEKLFSVSFPPIASHITSSLLPPNTDEFKDLTDAEKHTKLNSLEYTTGQKEKTQVGDGSMETPIGIEANKNRDKNKSAFEKSREASLDKKEKEREESAKEEQQQEKSNKISSIKG